MIVGDYMLVVSFLGIIGFIVLNGYDGFMYLVGWFIVYLMVLFIVVELFRNFGKYIFVDMLVYCFKD